MSGNQFQVHSLQSFLQEMSGNDSMPLCSNAYTIIWVQQGFGQISIDIDTFSITNDTVYFIKQGQALNIKIDENACGFIISFEKEFVVLHEKNTSELINTALFNHTLKIPFIKISNELNDFMKAIADEMLLEYKNYYELRLEILRGFLKIFIIYFSREFENNDHNNFQSRQVEIANFFYTQLEKNFTTKKLVREYAEMLFVSPGYLNEAIKQVTGFTASHHIQQRIVLEAKRKTIYEGYNLKEIAHHLGFWDPAHFSKYFKNSSGINFTQFKKGVAHFC